VQKANIKLNGHNWQVYLREEADQSVFNEIFKLKEYRSADDVIQNAKHPIVDVGAHAGFFSMYCRSLNKKVKIFAVEPEPNNLKLLKRHLAENKISGVKVIPGALAGETGERELLIFKDSHNHRLAEDEGDIKVKAFAFADFCKQNKIKKISLLKMDIEGGEYEVFDSMSEKDFAVVNYVILEYHSISNKLVSRLSYKQIEEKLRENGFAVQVFPSHFDKTMGFIFANNKRAKF
jgi:FkbM family methyltransferase